MQPTDAGYPPAKAPAPLHNSGVLPTRPTASANRVSGVRHCASSSPVCAEAEPPENMAPIIEKACPMLSARKITKPTSTTSRVYKCFSTAHAGFRPPLPCFSSPNSFLTAFSATIKKPCHRPQTIKVQFAPCHSPVQKNTISLFQ